jgi:hypothetical protein
MGDGHKPGEFEFKLEFDRRIEVMVLTHDKGEGLGHGRNVSEVGVGVGGPRWPGVVVSLGLLGGKSFFRLDHPATLDAAEVRLDGEDEARFVRGRGVVGTRREPCPYPRKALAPEGVNMKPWRIVLLAEARKVWGSSKLLWLEADKMEVMAGVRENLEGCAEVHGITVLN